MLYGSLDSESGDYRKAREELLEAEIALMKQRESVAKLRRSLPPGPEMKTYALRAGRFLPDGSLQQTDTSLAGLFADGGKPLVLYQFMLGGAQKEPCSMCTMWTDGFNAIAAHLEQRVNFSIIAQAGLDEFASLARKRGWMNLALVSCEESTFKRDLNFADEGGGQYPGISVFTRAPDGSIRHFYSACAIQGEDVFRGLDLYTPVWSILDLTPPGREDWMPAVHY